jgi:hypothetical protein
VFRIELLPELRGALGFGDRDRILPLMQRDA